MAWCRSVVLRSIGRDALLRRRDASAANALGKAGRILPYTSDRAIHDPNDTVYLENDRVTIEFGKRIVTGMPSIDLFA